MQPVKFEDPPDGSVILASSALRVLAIKPRSSAKTFTDMSFLTKKAPDGSTLVSIQPGHRTLLLNKAFRMVGEYRVDVLHFANFDDGWVCFALNRIRMSMLNSFNQETNTFGSDGSGSSKPVQYDRPVFIHVPEYRKPEGIFLCDRDGRVYGGSNTYPSGHSETKCSALCLGNSFNPLTLEPVELLLFNNANRDLSWKGDWLTGKWVKEPGITNKVFHIETWPTWTTKFPIPIEVVEASERLFPPIPIP